MRTMRLWSCKYESIPRLQNFCIHFMTEVRNRKLYTLSIISFHSYFHGQFLSRYESGCHSWTTFLRSLKFLFSVPTYLKKVTYKTEGLKLKNGDNNSDYNFNWTSIFIFSRYLSSCLILCSASTLISFLFHSPNW